MLKNKNKFTDRDLWVLQKPDFFSVINYRNKIRHSVSTYNE